MRELRDFFIVLIISTIALIIIDYIWFGGEYFAVFKQEWDLDISAVKRR